MSFLDDVRRALLLPEIAKASLVSTSGFRKSLLSALSELEGSSLPLERVEWLFDVWSDKLVLFVREMFWQLASGLAYGEQPSVVVTLVDIALRRRLGLSATTGSRTRDRELDRVSTEVLFLLDRPSRPTLVFPERYAFEVRALRHDGEGVVVTPIGKLLLDLPERDAVRWLLAVEVLQSTGVADPFRVSRVSALRISQANRLRVFWYGAPNSAAHSGTLDRLSALGILAVEDERDEAVSTYEVTDEGRALLAEVSAGDTPMTVLAAALSEDETAVMLARIRGASRLMQAESAAAATSRHARMVAHEIRNALVPVREAADDLFESLRRAGQEALVLRHGEPMITGVDRIFRFVTEMVKVAERPPRSVEVFDVGAAIEDALAAHFAELGHEVLFERPKVPISVQGRRDRFVLSMIDLLRNAYKSCEDRAPKVWVSAALDSSSTNVLVTIDDDGPGVPAHYREAIFEPGFSLRPGGTGLGLSFVREIVCKELLGEVRCEASPLGGARFVLRLPASPLSFRRSAA